MGEGFVKRLPNAKDAFFIKQGLNDLFGPSGLGGTQSKHNHLKGRYPNLFRHDAGATGAGRRQRSLRHAAWLLTDDIFHNAPADHQPKFRYWLRWLTWIERDPPNDAIVVVDGTVQGQDGMKPAEAILRTLFRALDRTRTVEFDWDPAPQGQPHLTVIVDRPGPGPYKIKVISRGWDTLDEAGYTKDTDSEDDF